ncbi:hypothetical protein BGX20_011700, partial [Mortierella sp. AD010]
PEREYIGDVPGQHESKDVAIASTEMEAQEVFDGRMLSALDAATRTAKAYSHDVDALQKV